MRFNRKILKFWESHVNGCFRSLLDKDLLLFLQKDSA